jgi:hypothetical protein
MLGLILSDQSERKHILLKGTLSLNHVRTCWKEQSIKAPLQKTWRQAGTCHEDKHGGPDLFNMRSGAWRHCCARRLGALVRTFGHLEASICRYFVSGTQITTIGILRHMLLKMSKAKISHMLSLSRISLSRTCRRERLNFTGICGART